MNAREMLALLEKHYAPPPSKPAGGKLIAEIQTPHSNHRADALWLPLTTAQRGQIIGHEIKVTRSDLITELRDPTKADSWLQYCHRWWLVVADPRMLEGLDVPPEWGVLAPPSNARTRFMTVIQKAPVLTPAPGPLLRAWATIWARVGYGDLGQEAALRRALSEGEHWRKAHTEAVARVRDLERTLGRDTEATLGLRVRVSEVMGIIEEMGGYSPETLEAFKGASYRVSAEQVARGILAAAVMAPDRRNVRDDLEIAVSRAESMLERLRAVLEEIDKDA